MIEIKFGDTQVIIKRGQLTEAHVDVVVREADASLAEELSPGGLAVNQAVLTDAEDLRAEKLIYTRLPNWQSRYHGEKIDLERSYQNALVAAIDGGLETVAFPPLGLGARGFPGYEATVIALNTIERVVTLKDRRTDYRGAIKRVEIIVDNDEDFELYRRVHRAYAHRWDGSGVAA